MHSIFSTPITRGVQAGLTSYHHFLFKHNLLRSLNPSSFIPLYSLSLSLSLSFFAAFGLSFILFYPHNLPTSLILVFASFAVMKPSLMYCSHNSQYQLSSSSVYYYYLGRTTHFDGYLYLRAHTPSSHRSFSLYISTFFPTHLLLYTPAPLLLSILKRYRHRNISNTALHTSISTPFYALTMLLLCGLSRLVSYGSSSFFVSIKTLLLILTVRPLLATSSHVVDTVEVHFGLWLSRPGTSIVFTCRA